jgi:hypothetical protein
MATDIMIILFHQLAIYMLPAFDSNLQNDLELHMENFLGSK